MADFFIDPENAPATSKSRPVKKTKKQQSAEEYDKVCARMAELRNRRKGLIQPSAEELQTKKEKAERAAVRKSNVRVVEKIVEKIVEKPVEVIREVIKEIPAKEVPAKRQHNNLFIDEDEILGNLRELKSWMSEMRVKPPTAEPSQPVEQVKKEEPPKIVEPVKKEPERYIFTGVQKGFRRVY